DDEGFWYIDTLDHFATPPNQEFATGEGGDYSRFWRAGYPPQLKAPAWQQDIEKLSAALHQAISSRPTARNRVTDEHLGKVAAVYRRAINDAIPPKQPVGDELHASTSTAGRWISLARRRVILGPTLPGKNGEVD